MSNLSFSFSLFGKHYFFTPKFTLATLVLLIVLLLLGVWQWKSAETMDKTIELINQRIAMDPISTDDLDKNGDLRYYHIQLQGSFDDQHQILIINRMYKNQQGFQVLTPFKLTDSSKEILVNRGWIAGDPSEKIPDFEDTPNGVTITGVLLQIPQSGAGFSKISWPLISKSIDIQKISQALGSPLYPYMVLLSPNSQYGYVRDWPWLTSIEPSRQKAYAKQWFALALTVFLVFIYLNVHRR
ncbi:MAG TPA: SURF1 family protein [Gammaproteobacteria bacterium]|nr:SURF1 family protein [Gammaproteobacteria bacterium]